MEEAVHDGIGILDTSFRTWLIFSIFIINCIIFYQHKLRQFFVDCNKNTGTDIDINKIEIEYNINDEWLLIE